MKSVQLILYPFLSHFRTNISKDTNNNQITFLYIIILENYKNVILFMGDFFTLSIISIRINF